MDPYQLYRERREKTPVYWDAAQRLWAVYPYHYCQQVLSNPAALIPPVANGALGGQALAVKQRLVRISNPPGHDLARQMALRMFRGRRPLPAADLLTQLLPPPGAPTAVEWVRVVAGVLPAMHILPGYGFSPRDTAVLQEQLPAILHIMAPVETPQAAQALEAAFDIVYPIVDRQVTHCFPGLTQETQQYAVSNLIGLLIQGYAATKGLLSLAVLHLLARAEVPSLAAQDMQFFLSFVTEVLRYDSPVHNTRRMLKEDVAIGGNSTHGCIAGAYCTELAAQAMCWLFHTYKTVRLVEAEPEYELLVNVKMVKEMHLELGARS